MNPKTYKRWVGRKMGRLTVLDYVPSPTDAQKWKCLCECGVIKDYYRTYLLSSKLLSCGCTRRDPRSPFREILRRYKRQARERNIEWNLTEDQFIEIVNKACIYCKIPPSNTESVSRQKYNGIDRLDSKKGYERGNVYACCIRCNRAKSNMSLVEFQEWVVDVYENMILDRN